MRLWGCWTTETGHKVIPSRLIPSDGAGMCGVAVKRHFNRLFFKEKQCNVSTQTEQNQRSLVSVIYIYLYLFSTLAGSAAYPSCLCSEAGRELCGGFSNRIANSDRQTPIHTHNLEKPSNGCRWTVGGVCAHTGGKAQRKAPCLKLGTLCCQVTVVTMTPPPPCHLFRMEHEGAVPASATIAPKCYWPTLKTANAGKKKLPADDWKWSFFWSHFYERAIFFLNLPV